MQNSDTGPVADSASTSFSGPHKTHFRRYFPPAKRIAWPPGGTDQPGTHGPLRSRTASCWAPTRLRSSSRPPCCSRCSPCSPRWCCRASAARRRCGRWRWCSSRPTLLAGYAYAHLLTSHLPGRLSVIVHVALMIVATFALPLAIAGGWGRPPDAGRGVLAARPVRGLDRTAVLRAVRQRSAAAGMVRAHRPSGRRRPIFPLRGEQRRQLPCAHLLSVR